MDWWTGMNSLFGAEGTTSTNASLQVKTPNDEVLLVVYDANVAMDGSAGRTAQGPRAYMGNGQDNAEPANYFTFTDDAKTVFTNLIEYMASLKTSKRDVTTPKLNVYGVEGGIKLPENSNASVYSVSGKLVKQGVNEKFVPASKGMYIVRSGNLSAKVMVVE